MLIFEPEPPLMRWSMAGEGRLTPAAGEFNLAAALPPAVTQALQSTASVGYVLRHGGAELSDPVTRLTPEGLSRLEPCVRFMPAANRLTLDIAHFGLTQRPQAAHFLFCETAFFAHLPTVASTYALPYEFYVEGLRRYGGDGLCHQWAWRQAASRLGSAARRVISIHLGDSPSVAALSEGRPIETSLGFSPLETLPSATGSGDFDPTIVSFLRSTGLSTAELTRLLTQESGFGALVGHPARWADIMADDSPGAEAARALLLKGVVKMVGMCLAALGGAEALVFASEEAPPATHPFVLEICRELDFLGLDYPPGPGAENRGRLEAGAGAGSRSPIKILELHAQRAAMLAALAPSA